MKIDKTRVFFVMQPDFIMYFLNKVPLVPPPVDKSVDPSAQLDFQAALCEVLEQHQRQVKRATELEVAQHALDYSQFVDEHSENVDGVVNIENNATSQDEPLEDPTGGSRIHWNPENMETRFVSFLNKLKPTEHLPNSVC